MDELLPCPFCESKAEIEHYDNDGYLPHCSKCDGMIEHWFVNGKDAINAWNNRIK